MKGIFKRIINICPWPGGLNLLEIFILILGLGLSGLLSGYTSYLNQLLTQSLNDLSSSKIQLMGEQIHQVNLLLSVGIGSLVIILSFSLWRNRKNKQYQMSQLQTEKEQSIHLHMALNSEQNKFSATIDNLPDAIFVVDGQDQIVIANQAAAHLAGLLKPELMIGKTLSDILPPALANKFSEEDQSILEAGNSLINKEETLLSQSTGKKLQLLVNKAPVRNEKGQIIGLVGIIRDITAQKQAEDALKVANAKLIEGIAELEERTQEMDLLTQMIDLLTACPTEVEAFKVIESQLERLNLADAGILYMINASRNNVEQVAAWGQAISETPVFTPGDCWGLRRGRLHLVEYNRSTRQKDLAGNTLICPHIMAVLPSDYLCLPLVAQGETLGIMHLRHFIGVGPGEQMEAPEKWFTPQKVHRINMVAESLALAIANLMLRTTLRQQSIRDPLTGLFNRRYLEETLERELLRASRSKKTVGLIMIDIDHFKQFNDIYGHPAADAFLSNLGNLFLMCIRGEDLACRYGGDEFLLVLPDTDLETTCQRAEEIREKVAQMSVLYHGQNLQQISISIGVGIFPDQGQTPETLIQNVDRSLYQAKNKGRNRIAINTSDTPE